MNAFTLRPKKIKGLFALLASKLGGLIGRSFFFFNLDTDGIQYVCAFLGIQTLKIGLILVLEGIVFHYIWLKYPFGIVTIYSDILF